MQEIDATAARVEVFNLHSDIHSDKVSRPDDQVRSVTGEATSSAGSLLPPIRKKENMVTVAPKEALTRSEVFHRYVKPLFGGKASAFHSTRWFGGTMRLAFHSPDQAEFYVKEASARFGDEASFKFEPIRVSIKIKGLEPSLDPEQIEGFVRLYRISDIRFLANRAGERIPIAFGRAPLHVAQLLDRQKHGGFAGCGLTFELAQGDDDRWTFPHCQKCHRWGHWIQSCSKPGRCGRCAEEDHGSCGSTVYKCCNCNGSHPAWSRKCPAFLAYKKCWASLLPAGSCGPESHSSNLPSSPAVTRMEAGSEETTKVSQMLEDLNRAMEQRFSVLAKGMEKIVGDFISKTFGGLLTSCSSAPAQAPPIETKKRPSSPPIGRLRLRLLKQKQGDSVWTPAPPPLPTRDDRLAPETLTEGSSNSSGFDVT